MGRRHCRCVPGLETIVIRAAYFSVMACLCALAFVVGLALSKRVVVLPAPAPAKTETLSCVRVKQVTPAGTINYLCEVKNGRP